MPLGHRAENRGWARKEREEGREERRRRPRKKAHTHTKKAKEGRIF